MNIEESIYGPLPTGEHVRLWTLRHDHSIVARLTGFGAILVGLETPRAPVAGEMIREDTMESCQPTPRP